MKHLLILSLVLAGCSQNNEQTDGTSKPAEPLVIPAEKAYQVARQFAGTSQLDEKSLLLGFSAGMNRTESILNLKRQNEAGRIHMGSVSGLQGALYTLTTDSGKLMQGFMGFDYVNGQLAKVSLTFFNTSCNASVVEELVNTLAKKYGKPTHSYTSSSNYNEHSAWLKGGREINVFCDTSSPVIEYSAVKLIDNKPSADAAQKKREAKKSLQDL